MESHGYVQRDSESLLFGHPNYQAAFEYVTDNLLESQFTDLISIASRGVAVLDPAIALNVLRSLGRLCEVFKNNVLRRQRLLQMIYSALQSIYPSVIDGALVFLLKYVNDLSEEKRDSVFRLVEQNIEIERVCWFKGMCWLNYQPTISASFADRLFPRYTIPMDRIKDAIIDLSDPSKVTSVTPEEAWNILQAIKRGDIDHDNVLLYQHLLAHEESFIRSKAAWLLASRFSPANPGIIGRLLGDEHPRVAYESLRGCFACWNTYEGQAKPSLREAAKLSLAKPGVAIAARRFLSDFGDSYGADHIERVDITREQEKALWDLWASIFPSFLRSLPEASIGINQPHLWDTARKACEFISSEQGLQIAEAWFEWIDQKLQKSLPKEFGLGVGDFLINATKGKPDLRFELLKKILAHLDSHFVFVAIADFIESWNDLTSSEKAFICNTLAGNRTDLRWLKAVALTREQVASEIETQILGTSINLSLDADTLLSTLAPELLSDCLHVYCGTPQPLWFLGKHHSEAEVWRRVMIKLCEKPEHPLFQMSLLEILVHKRHAHRDDGPQVWAALCKTKDEKLRDRLFELLLDSTIKGDDMVEYWAPFMKAISTDERAKFINKVIEKLPMLEYRDHRAPWTVIGEYTFFEILLPRLKGDKLILEAISLFRSIYESEDSKPGSAIKVKDDLISLLNLIYDNSPPKLLMTAAIVKSFLDDAESAEAKNLIEKCAKATSAKHLSWNQREYTPEPHGLPQWNSIFVEDATQS